MKVKTYRKLHSLLVPSFVLFFLIMSFSGLVLAWKKNSAGILIPDAKHGLSTDMQSWLPVDSLAKFAKKALKETVSADISVEISKIDIRPSKALAKFIFKEKYYQVQLDCTTGKVLSVDRRHADLIEQIHDGSIIDHIFELSGSPVKLFYSSLLALIALFMSVTGFIIWNKRRNKIKLKKITYEDIFCRFN